MGLFSKSLFQKTLNNAEKAINEGRQRDAFLIISELYDQERFSESNTTSKVEGSLKTLDFKLQDLMNNLERFGTIHKRAVKLSGAEKVLYIDKIDEIRNIINDLKIQCKVLLKKL